MKMSNNKPVFTEIELVPSHLDLTFKEWQSMPLHELKRNIEIVKNHIKDNVVEKNHDFFSGNMSLEEIIDNMRNINDNDEAELILPPSMKTLTNNRIDYGSGILKYNTQKTRVINRWFPEKSFAKNIAGKSVNDQFYNSEEFMNNVFALIVKDRFKFSKSCPDAIASKFLREGLRLVNGNQPMQNFPVDVAKWILLDYSTRKLKSSDLFIVDPCMGWASRLVSALAICNNPLLKNKKVHYFGTEVNSTILERYSMIVDFWREYINPNINFELYHPISILPFEDIFQDSIFRDLKGRFDVAFTSPPYCHTEKYSSDKEQSYMRYPNYYGDDELSWRKNFLIPLFQNTYALLKDNGEFWLNIADGGVSNGGGSSKVPLESDSIKIAKETGYHYKSRYKISMPTHGNFKKGNKSKTTDMLLLDGKRRKAEPLLKFIKFGGQK
jgi:hypothetical protein